MIPPVKNEKGQYILYDKGVPIGATDVLIIDGCIVPVSVAPTIMKMKSDAAKDDVKLTLAVGIRTIEKQVISRRKNLILTKKLAEYKKNDPAQYEIMVDELVMDGSPKLFKPETGIPGHSKHQKGTAFDWNVTRLDVDGKKIGMLPSYKWLRDNAWKYGMVRKIQSEEWHFEVGLLSAPFTALQTFTFVPKGHLSWAGSI